MAVESFTIMLIEDGGRPINTTRINAFDDGTAPLNPVLDLTDRTNLLEIHDESGILDDRVQMVVNDDGWRSNYPLSQGLDGSIRDRTRIYLSHRSALRITMNGINKGDYEFDGMEKHPHRGLVTLRGVRGFDGDKIAQQMVEFLDNGVLFNDEYNKVVKKPLAERFHIPKPNLDLGEDVETYIWRFHARWESMLGSLRWNEILKDLGAETFNIKAGEFETETLTTPTVGPFLASLLSNAERPRYREVVGILNRFGLKIYFGGTPRSWRLERLQSGQVSIGIVPLEWTHSTLHLEDSDFIGLSPNERIDDAAIMNEEWQSRELTFTGEDSLDQVFNIQRG